MSQALSGTRHLKSAIQEAIDVLARHHRAASLAVWLRDDASGQLIVEAATRAPGAWPLSAAPDEIVDHVVETGRPVLVPRVDASSRPGRPGAKRGPAPLDRTVICAPLLFQDIPVGAIRAELPFKGDRNYDRSQGFYRVVASMIGEALRLSRLVEAERRRLSGDAPAPSRRPELAPCRHIIGTSAAIQRVHRQVDQVADGTTTVLIRGESGTGKELIARAIHQASPRARRAFITVSCAALPEALLESELFGYERGAFTGAQGLKKGRFELADGGTLFLDEIGDLAPAMQVKLLRVLQEREIERLGGTQPIKLDVRLITATHRPLETLIAAGTFREDLYYRLNVFTIVSPALRDRRPDIALLADHFLERFAREHRRGVRRLSPGALGMLAGHHWPGNVRELENTIERAVLTCDGGVLHGYHLPPALQTVDTPGAFAGGGLAEATAAFERDLIQEALAAAQGNAERAARHLHTTARIVRYKVRKYGIDCARFLA